MTVIFSWKMRVIEWVDLVWIGLGRVGPIYISRLSEQRRFHLSGTSIGMGPREDDMINRGKENVACVIGDLRSQMGHREGCGLSAIFVVLPDPDGRWLIHSIISTLCKRSGSISFWSLIDLSNGWNSTSMSVDCWIIGGQHLFSQFGRQHVTGISCVYLI